MTEEEESTPENQSFIHKLKEKLLKKKSSEEGGEEADDDEAAKKKKRSRIIQIVIVVGVVAFIFSDEFLPKDDEAPPEEGQVKLKPRPKPTKPAQAETPPANASGNAETPKAADTPVETPNADTPVETAESGDTTIGQTSDLDTVSDTTITTPDSPVDVTATDLSSDSSQLNASGEVPSSDTSDTDFGLSDIPQVDTPSDFGLSDPSLNGDTADSIDGSETVSGGDENITDQILLDLEKQAKDSKPAEQITQYVAPPDYEYKGRGLVYNCTGKHWACVDGPSYKACEDNNASVKYLNKKVECHPYNIYETDRGCEIMQNRLVSSSANTDFCN